MRGLTMLNCKLFIVNHNCLMICSLFHSNEWIVGLEWEILWISAIPTEKSNAYLPTSNSQLWQHRIEIYKEYNKNSANN